MTNGRLWHVVALVPLLCGVSCAKQVSAEEARRKADEYARTEWNLDDLRRINVDTVEQPHNWVVTYTAKGQAAGGPLVLGVEKKSGRVYFIAGGQ